MDSNGSLKTELKRKSFQYRQARHLSSDFPGRGEWRSKGKSSTIEARMEVRYTETSSSTVEL